MDVNDYTIVVVEREKPERERPVIYDAHGTPLRRTEPRIGFDHRPAKTNTSEPR